MAFATLRSDASTSSVAMFDELNVRWGVLYDIRPVGSDGSIIVSSSSVAQGAISTAATINRFNLASSVQLCIKKADRNQILLIKAEAPVPHTDSATPSENRANPDIVSASKPPSKIAAFALKLYLGY